MKFIEDPNRRIHSGATVEGNVGEETKGQICGMGMRAGGPIDCSGRVIRRVLAERKW